MENLNKSILIYNDENYKYAVNYSGFMFNNPITLNYGEKHRRVKYILPCGSCDNISILQDGIYIYIVSENSGLNYISLEEIDTENKTIQSIFLDSNEIDNNEEFTDILNLTSEQQIKILTQYLN